MTYLPNPVSWLGGSGLIEVEPDTTNADLAQDRPAISGIRSLTDQETSSKIRSKQ